MAVAAGVVFDLDDTLYLERDYVASGFRTIARLVSKFLQMDSESVYERLMNWFRQGERGRTFDLLMEQFPALRLKYSVEDLVDAYRKHQPDIYLLPGITELLHLLRRAGIRHGLLSDGYLSAQRIKVSTLKLEPLLDVVVLTDDWGKDYWKPHPRGFEYIEKAWSLNGSALVYVGDNPSKDFVTPNKMGWRTIRLRLHGQLHFETEAPGPSHAATFEVTSVTELAEVLLG